MIRMHAVAVFCLCALACKSTGMPQPADGTPAGFEEHFTGDNSMILIGEGIAPSSLSAQHDKALAYARLDARLDAEQRFGDICYGVSVRPCEPKRRVEPRVAEALKRDLRQTREKCYTPTAAEPASCRIHFEFRYEGIRRLCENARSEDSMKILSAGCGTW